MSVSKIIHPLFGDPSRLQTLASYQLWDTPEEDSFNELARLASYICQTPIALISLMDANRQWHKAKVGMETSSTELEHTFCQYTAIQSDLMEVPDSLLDPRFRDNPSVVGEPNIRFYAGMPLVSPEGHMIGTMCVIDKMPKNLSEEQKEALRTIAKQVMVQMELRRNNLVLIDERNSLLSEKFQNAQAKLKEQKSEIGSLREAIRVSSAMMRLALDGTIKEVNDTMATILGYEEVELLGTSHKALVQEEYQGDWESLWKQLITGRFHQGRFKRKSKQGEAVWIQANYIPIKDIKGRVIEILKLAQDITHEMEVQQDLERATAAKDVFLANMSHEIRTPLNAILGFTDLLLSDEMLDGQREYLESIKIAGSGLLVLINDILDVSKIESGTLTLERANFSPRHIVQNVRQMLSLKAKEKGISLLVEIGDGMPDELMGDKFRLSQILYNLIGNAIKFTEEGFVRVLVNVDDKSVLHVRIIDTGIGIPKEESEKLFNRFSQVEEHKPRISGGAGLGLNISKLLVELQGGTIGFTSEVGQGSEFFFYIPYEKAIIDERPAINQNQSERSLEGVRVLLCEDNHLNQVLARKVLEGFGCTLEIVNNGQEAIELWQHDSAFDIILMDIQMPEMDGYETTHHFREVLGITVPIIAMTAHSLVREKEKCLRMGMNDYLSKPFSKEDLRQKMEQCINISTVDMDSSINTSSINHSEPDIDFSYLDSLTLDDYTFKKGILEEFLLGIPVTLSLWKQYIDQENNKDLVNSLHRFKSSLGMLGARNLIALLEEVEYGDWQSLSPAEKNTWWHSMTQMIEKLAEKVRQSIRE